LGKIGKKGVCGRVIRDTRQKEKKTILHVVQGVFERRGAQQGETPPLAKHTKKEKRRGENVRKKKKKGLN